MDDTISIDRNSTTSESNVSAEHANFLLLNIGRLLLNSGKNKSKISYLHEQASSKTPFYALCETFLNEDIINAEIIMPGFTLERIVIE